MDRKGLLDEVEAAIIEALETGPDAPYLASDRYKAEAGKATLPREDPHRFRIDGWVDLRRVAEAAIAAVEKARRQGSRPS